MYCDPWQRFTLGEEARAVDKQVTQQQETGRIRRHCGSGVCSHGCTATYSTNVKANYNMFKTESLFQGNNFYSLQCLKYKT